MVFLGALVGWLLALAVGQMLGAIESDPDIEITLSTILAYFSFRCRTRIYVSGIMAVVAAGIMMGSWGQNKISPLRKVYEALLGVSGLHR